MWPYNDDENGWIGQKVADPAYIPRNASFRLTPELIEFYRRRAHQLRREAIAGFFRALARNAAEMFRHLSLLSSGNRAKIEAAIAELRHQNATQPNAGTAGR